MNKNQKRFGVFEILLVVPIFFIIGYSAFYLLTSNSKTDRLQKAADEKQTALNQLTFLNGQSTSASGVVDGDSLTANPNPDISTFAQASFTTNSPLNVLESQVSINLNKSGFVREGPAETPYYNTVRDSYLGASGINFIYKNGNRAVKAIYTFDKAYGCATGYVCKHTASNNDAKNIYPVQGYGKLTVVRVQVYYAAANNYKVQL